MRQQLLLVVLVEVEEELTPLQGPQQRQQQGRRQMAAPLQQLKAGVLELVVVVASHTGATAGAAPRLHSQVLRQQRQTPRAEEGQQRQLAAAARACMQ